MGFSRDTLNNISANFRNRANGLLSGNFWQSWRFFAAFGIIFVGSLVLGEYAQALNIEKYVAIFIGWIAQYILSFEGLVLLAVVNYVLIPIAKYNNFIDSSAVETGWFIVRDISNMFYVLVLLAIAFGTILGVGNYSYEKALPKLLISAIIVNFSRTICGLLIDLAQVVMLTFVNGFSLAAGGNFAKAFKIDKMLMYSKDLSPDSTEAYAVIAGLFLAVVLIGFAIVMVVYISVLLVMRIVYLWILIILSPLAFLLRAVPAGAAGKYYGEWWQEFIKHTVTGPVLAFFLWLSLLVVANDGITKDIPKVGTVDTPAVTIPTQIFQPENLQGFIIAICLLYAGTVVAGKLGAPGMGRVAGAAKGAGSSVLSGARKAARGVGATARLAGRGASAVGNNTGLGRVGTSAKMGMYDTMSRIPGLRERGFQGKDRIRLQESARGGQVAGMISRMKPQELDSYARSLSSKPSALMSAEDKGKLKLARAQQLRNASTGDGVVRQKGETDAAYGARVRDDFQAKRRDYEKLSKETYDTGSKANMKSIFDKRPDLIIDKDENDPEKMELQRQSLRRTAGNMGVNQLQGLDSSGITQPVVMNMSANMLEKALKGGKLTGDQETALDGMGIKTGMSTQEISARQQELKRDNSGFLVKSEREQMAQQSINQMNAAPPGESGADQRANAARAALMASGNMNSEKMMSDFAAAGQGGTAVELMNSGQHQVDAAALENSPELARQMALGDASGAAAQRQDRIGEIIRQSLAGAVRDNASDVGTREMAADNASRAGMSVSDTFGAESGGVLDQSSRQAFGSWVSASQVRSADSSKQSDAQAQDAKRAERLSRLSSSELRQGGHSNEMAQQVVMNVSMNDLNSVAAQRPETAAAIVDQAEAMSEMDIDKEVAKFEGNEGMQQAERARLDEIQRQAKKILSSVSSGDSSPLIAALKNAKSEIGKTAFGVAKLERKLTKIAKDNETDKLAREVRGKKPKGRGRGGA